MIYLLLNFTLLTVFLLRYPLALKMKNQEDSKVKPDQLKKHGPLPFLEISLYWVLWILMCLYSMYSIFLASRGMTCQTTVHMYFNCPNKMAPVSTFLILLQTIWKYSPLSIIGFPLISYRRIVIKLPPLTSPLLFALRLMLYFKFV